MLRVTRIIAVFAGVLVMSGCGPASPRIPTAPPNVIGLTALLGPIRLGIEPGGDVMCVVGIGVDTHTVTALVWPNGYSIRGSNPLTITDEAGAEIAKVGDVVWLGGGLSPATDPLEGCPDHGRIWWIADVTHSAPTLQGASHERSALR